MVTVEQVLEFLNDDKASKKLTEFIEKSVKELNLPTDIKALEDDDLLDEIKDDAVCFFCDVGQYDERDNVYLVGYNPKTRELLVEGTENLCGICPVGLDELEFNSLVELAKALYYCSADKMFCNTVAKY